MVSDVTGLTGNKRVTVTQQAKGYAGLSGDFRLSFKGAKTGLIDHSWTAAQLKDALQAIDTIPVGALTVTTEAGLAPEKMWRVTFSQLVGDVEDLVCHPHHMHLRGNGADLVVHTDGTETSFERRGRLWDGWALGWERLRR